MTDAEIKKIMKSILQSYYGENLENYSDDPKIISECIDKVIDKVGLYDLLDFLLSHPHPIADLLEEEKHKSQNCTEKYSQLTGLEFVESIRSDKRLSECISCSKLDSCSKASKTLKALRDDVEYCAKNPDCQIVMSFDKDYETICMDYYQKNFSKDPMWYNKAINGPYAILK